MWRYSIASIIGSGTDKDPWRADVAGAWVCVHAFPSVMRVLIKQVVPDGTATDATTIADVSRDADGVQVDINSEAITSQERTAIRTWLANNGFPNEWVDASITDRKKLLLALVRALADRLDIDVRMLLSGYDVA